MNRGKWSTVERKTSKGNWLQAELVEGATPDRPFVSGMCMWEGCQLVGIAWPRVGEGG